MVEENNKEDEKYFKGLQASLTEDYIQTEPYYKELNVDYLNQIFSELFFDRSNDRELIGQEQALMHRVYPERNIRVHTNAYGFDSFEENIEKQTLGTIRIYLGKKVMRILKRTGKIFKSASGRHYKRIKV